ncbi:MAG: hypothetical protein WAX69_04190, partial [Victivallales bacterium]
AKAGRQTDSPLIAWIISHSCQASWQGTGNVQKNHCSFRRESRMEFELKSGFILAPEFTSYRHFVRVTGYF